MTNILWNGLYWICRIFIATSVLTAVRAYNTSKRINHETVVMILNGCNTSKLSTSKYFNHIYFYEPETK